MLFYVDEIFELKLSQAKILFHHIKNDDEMRTFHK